jgi:hypothetical protein
MSNAQEVMEAQAKAVKTSQEAALASRIKHGLAKIQLEKDEALRALNVKMLDPKATVVAIEAAVAAEFCPRRENLLKNEEEYKTADIMATYNENLLSILKIVNSSK